MTADVVSYRSRKKGGPDPAAKAKRDKIVLAVCGVVLLALVAFQGPKMLKRMHGSSSPATPAASAPAASTGAPAATPAHRAVSLKALGRLQSKDPFVAQLGGSTGAPAPGPTPVAGPPVRASHFVAKDPFVAQLSLSSPAPAGTTPGPVPGNPQGATGSSGNYIVMLASIPLSYGHGAAGRAAASARKAGVSNVKIVDSSGYPTLRTGFYAVYSGPYPTLAELQPVLEQIRGQGYPSAYTRRLAK